MIPFILHAGLILSGCLLFYKILLQKETFYRLNRVVLLGSLFLAFGLPLVKIPEQWSIRKAERQVVSGSPDLSIYPVIAAAEERESSAGSTTQQPVPQQNSNYALVSKWLLLLYWFGVGVFGINFFVQLLTLYYRVYTSPCIKDGKFRIVELSGDKAPCSFGNNIFINPEKYDWETYNQILSHEKIHIEQGHTLDIILTEIILIFQWFNPFAWLYRGEVEKNLEFLTDNELLRDPSIERTSYQMSLLKVSVPHFPLSLTTNYNQSLLKKRLIMMNAKRSSVHTRWKYFFMLPLMVLFVCLLNEPIALGQQQPPVLENKSKSQNTNQTGGLRIAGAWFASIKDDKISIQFKNDNEENNSNSTIFFLSEIKNLPKDQSGTFSVTREAGTIQFTGRFEGTTGMGRYQFTSEKAFAEFLRSEGIGDTDDQDMFAFFMVDLKKSYMHMLSQQGYKGLGKHELLPLAALKVDATYIESLKRSGFSALGVHEMISLKALGVDSEFIQDIRNAGYKNITANQLVAFKAQGINGKYIAEMREAAKKEGKADPVDLESPDDIVARKALHVDAAYIRALKEAGFDNLSNSDLVAMKAHGITPEYIKNLQAMGFKNIQASDIIAFKAENITQEYIKSFAAAGYTDIDISDIVSLKTLGITPEYIKGFQAIGFQKISREDAVSLKSHGITPAMVQEYKALGYTNISVEDVVAAVATGTTPTFITSMKEKGHNLKSLQKYIQLKTAID
jgi:beta-lactamase regulating signal transducer with metallopeptidase domain